MIRSSYVCFYWTIIIILLLLNEEFLFENQRAHDQYVLDKT